MSSVQHTSDFVPNIIHPLIRSFLERTTAEQWGSFISGSADDATKILVAELILEIIAALSSSVVTSLKLPKTEEHLMSELEESLPQTFSEALGIPDEVDNLRLKTLTGIIQEEVKYNLFRGGKARITKYLTPVAIINSMTDQLIQLFQKFSEKIKTFIVPRPCKSPDGSPKQAATLPTSQVIKYKIDNELREIIIPLLENIPDSEELQQELSSKIQKSAEMILSSLTSQFADPQPQHLDTEDSFLLMFKHLRGDKVTAFAQELSYLISRHVLPEPSPQPAPKTLFGKSSAVQQPQSKAQAEVWSKTWIFMVLMNWFMTTQVNSVINRPSNFVPNIIHPLIRSFLEKTTAEQWGSFQARSADDATKILVAELILEIIAALSNFILTSPMTPKTEKLLMSELEESLPQTFSEALGIPDEVDNLRLKTLTGIIHEEVKYNLFSGGKAGITKHLTPVARLNAMTDQLIHLFQKFSEKIKSFIVPLPRRSRGEAGAPTHVASKVSITSPTSQVIKQEINTELRDIIDPLLEDIPDFEELQQERSSEIQKVADEVVCTFYEMQSKKS
ncbi:unnamed protein product, partial [Tetraodon nigroviridis]